MKNALRPVPDFLTKTVVDLWSDVRGCVERAGQVKPILCYFVGDQAYSIPLSYADMVQRGVQMRGGFGSATAYMASMGPDFGMLAMELATRAEIESNTLIDGRSYVEHVQHMLHHIGPQAFFISIPIRFVSGEFDPVQAARAMRLGPANPDAQDAVLVMGRNPVRSYGLLTPFVKDRRGQFYYEDSIVLDSFDGSYHKDGIFGDIYEPSRN